ncbi:hypothetical protein [Parachryseolinea silvisoli]|uniref:hypothetical protein n=1 Tax=Parachryseolinea silvisoli TaxID=2873601 RepID=UPI002265CD91|nr:hypothetical protein [Parachryseolinea silvisoli]MCD9014447.1 hypothetical protein [Parachryseolinea silvisoli]
MKNRGFFLAVVAVVIASTTGFTLSLLPLATTVYIKIRSSSNPMWHCVNTELQCSESGSANCYVNVAVDLPPTPAVNTDGRKWNGTDCIKIMNTTNVNPSYNPVETVTAVAPIE